MAVAAGAVAELALGQLWWEVLAVVAAQCLGPAILPQLYRLLWMS